MDLPYALLYRDYVLNHYERAAEAFAANPQGDNWINLKAAMYAWQSVRQMSMEELEATALALVMRLATESRGDTNIGEIG